MNEAEYRRKAESARRDSFAQATREQLKRPGLWAKVLGLLLGVKTTKRLKQR